MLLFLKKQNLIFLQKERTRKDRKGRKNKNGTNNVGNKSSLKDGRSQSVKQRTGKRRCILM